MNIFERSRHLAYERLKGWINGAPLHRLERTLVIIDMQDHFVDTNKPLLYDLVSTICKLIKHAKQEKWAIIIVEYLDTSHTNTTIVECLGDYPHQETVIKQNEDGGREIVECLNNNRTWSLNLLVCGVYGHQCVASTVAGLFEHNDLLEVDVITDAVFPKYCSSSRLNEHNQQREQEVVMENILV